MRVDSVAIRVADQLDGFPWFFLFSVSVCLLVCIFLSFCSDLVLQYIDSCRFVFCYFLGVRLSFFSALFSRSSFWVFFLSLSSYFSVSSSCLSVFCSCLSVLISCSSLSCNWLSVFLIWFLSSVALFSDASLCSEISSCSLLLMSFSALFSVVALWFSSFKRLFSCSFWLSFSDWSW